MLIDNLNLVAAILGAALGLFIAFRLGAFRRSGGERDRIPAELSRPTGYVSTTHQPSAAPILGAMGAALLGVGIVVTSSIGGIGLVLVAVGIAVLGAALFIAVRRRSDILRP